MTNLKKNKNKQFNWRVNLQSILNYYVENLSVIHNS